MGPARKCKAARRESQSSEESWESGLSSLLSLGKRKRIKFNSNEAHAELHIPTPSTSSNTESTESLPTASTLSLKKCKAIRSEAHSSDDSDSSNNSASGRRTCKRHKSDSDEATAIHELSILNTTNTKSTGSSTSSHKSIFDLPNELLETIFRWLPFEAIGKIRLVSRDFNEVCSSVLNLEFQKIRSSMQQRFQCIKAQMPRRESARRKHKLAAESDIVETMHMRLTLLHMTFGKHIERKHCCFFAGEILDEVNRIIHHIKVTPNISRAYKVTDELFDLSTMAMEYFKERIEPTLPEITYITTDFFDYTPSFSLATSKSLSLMDDPATTSACRNSCTSSQMSLSSGSPLPSTSTVFQSISEVAPPIAPAVRKRLRNLRDSVKRNNGQVLSLKRELKMTQRRMTNQQKQIHELKARYEDYDKKFQNSSRKLNAVLQELSRCKTELQYWRSKSPANSSCVCGKSTPIVELSKEASDQSGLQGDLELDDNQDFNDNLDDELENAFPDEFKPIPLNENVESKPLSSDHSVTKQHPLIVVPACHSAILMVAESSLTTCSSMKNGKMTNTNRQRFSPKCRLLNKPLTRATKRKLEISSEVGELKPKDIDIPVGKD